VFKGLNIFAGYHPILATYESVQTRLT